MNKIENFTFRKLQVMLCAMARASSVLPVPGGPYNKTPQNFANFNISFMQNVISKLIFNCL